MEHELVVTRPFGAFERGAVISDPVQIQLILDSENANHVVRRLAAKSEEE